MIALPRPARPTSAIARDVVRVNSSMLARVPGPGRHRRDGGDDLGVVDLGHCRDGVDDGDGRLPGAGHHVDVHRVEVGIDVGARHHEGPDRSGREVDRPDPQLGVPRRIGDVDIRAGCLEHDVGQFALGEQPVDAVGRCLEPCLAGTLQSVAPRVDTDHVARLDHLGAHQFVHQVGTDVAGPDDRCGHLGHGTYSAPTAPPEEGPAFLPAERTCPVTRVCASPSLNLRGRGNTQRRPKSRPLNLRGRGNTQPPAKIAPAQPARERQYATGGRNRASPPESSVTI